MDKSLINHAVECLELLDIFLYSSKVNRFEEIYHDDYPEGMGQQSKLSITADLLQSIPVDDEDSHQIIQAKLTFGNRFVKKGEKKDEYIPLAEIEACFVAKYFLKSELTEEAVKEFVKHNSVHNVWPFWREHAFRMSNEAHLPNPKIGLYKQKS